MTFDEIKKKRLERAFGDRLPKKNASNQSGGTLGEDAESSALEEGKKHQTPAFIKHCVSAIVEKPKDLARIEQKKDGSPFGICTAKYKQNKQSLAAKHSQGKHHTIKQYEKALAKLREETEQLRESRPSRRSISFAKLTEIQDRRRATAFKPL